jgi:hypothetical protein
MKKRKRRNRLAYKLIPLTRGMVAAVSPEDFALASRYKWHPGWNRGRCEVLGGVGRKTIRLARLIMGLRAGDTRQVDHWNRNALDNRRCNLRLCTRAGNMLNRERMSRGGGSTSTCYRGVDRCLGITGEKGGRSFRTRLRDGKRYINIGSFASARAAAHAYDDFRRERGDTFFMPNFPKCSELPPAPPAAICHQVLRGPTPEAASRPRGKRVCPFKGVGALRSAYTGKIKWYWHVQYRGRIRRKHGFLCAKSAARARELFIIENNLPHYRNFPGLTRQQLLPKEK